MPSPGGFLRGGHLPRLSRLDSHILGFTLWEAGHAIKPEEIAGIKALLPKLTADGYPYLAEHAAQHLTGTGHQEHGEFEFGLRLIIDGLTRIRAVP